MLLWKRVSEEERKRGKGKDERERLLIPTCSVVRALAGTWKTARRARRSNLRRAGREQKERRGGKEGREGGKRRTEEEETRKGREKEILPFAHGRAGAAKGASHVHIRAQKMLGCRIQGDAS
jgi:hypothetical protein